MAAQTPTQLHPNRTALLRHALLLVNLGIAWILIEGVASVILGRLSHSVLLEAFGIDSAIEILSAITVGWRLHIESRTDADPARIERVERTASRICGRLLFLLAAYVAITSAMAIMSHESANTHLTAWGILIGIGAKTIMPALAAAKLKAATALESAALRADAMEAITCAFLSLVLIIGLAAEQLLHWQYVDSIAALALIPFLIKEGREAISGQCDCCH